MSERTRFVVVSRFDRAAASHSFRVELLGRGRTRRAALRKNLAITMPTTSDLHPFAW